MKGKILRENRGISQWYRKKLNSITKTFTKVCISRLINLYKRDKNQVSFAQDEDITFGFEVIVDFEKQYTGIYEKFAEKTVRTFVNKSDSNADYTLRKSLEKMNSDQIKIKKNIKSKELDATIEAIVSENMSLIKSIPEEFFKKLTTAMTQAVQNGESLTQFKKQLMKIKGMTERRASMIAQDQSNKAFNAIARRKAQACGVKQFEWIHTGIAKNPRPYHKNVLNHKIFDFDEPPIIDPNTKIRGYPAQLINCRCMMRPVVSFKHK